MNAIYRNQGILGWYFGGPAYMSKLHAGTAEMLAAMSVHASRDGDAILGYDFAHTSILPQGRAQLLWRAMQSDADILVSMDADTFMREPQRWMADIRRLSFQAEPWALLGVCVPQTDGRINAWEADGQRASELLVGIPTPLWAIGGALVAYNLPWYRTHFGSLREVACSYAMVAAPAGQGDAFIGEDVWHCGTVRAKGGQILGLRFGKVGHGRVAS